MISNCFQACSFSMQISNTEEEIVIDKDEPTEEFLRYVFNDNDLQMSGGKSDSDIPQEIINSKDSCSNDIDSESKHEKKNEPPLTATEAW